IGVSKLEFTSMLACAADDNESTNPTTNPRKKIFFTLPPPFMFLKINAPEGITGNVPCEYVVVKNTKLLFLGK
ncbi:MAG TPA: hypothetical protein PLA52_03705, partial [Candidatus Omnitrophota bacterium]|nr:hypothetical protein [Candidatus Omnitrophota bacterium]HRZ67056.1 hypothetical protein [Candidatus Omnitrophota bacterium]